MKDLLRYGYILALFGTAMFLIVLIVFLDNKDFLSRASNAEGIVIGLEKIRSSGPGKSNTFSPVVSFITANGEKVTFKSNSSSNPPSFNVGEKVDVLYIPGAPEQAKIDTIWQIWGLAIFATMFGIISFSIYFLAIFPLKLKDRMSNRLKLNGRKILVNFQEIKVNNMVNSKSKKPYKIIANWVNPIDNKSYSFESDEIFFNPEPYIKDSKLYVYVDKIDLRKYYLDISFLPEP